MSPAGKILLKPPAADVGKYNFITKSKAMIQSHFNRRSDKNSTFTSKMYGARGNCEERGFEKYVTTKARTPPIYSDKDRNTRIKEIKSHITHMLSKLKPSH